MVLGCGEYFSGRLAPYVQRDGFVRRRTRYASQSSDNQSHQWRTPHQDGHVSNSASVQARSVSASAGFVCLSSVVLPISVALRSFLKVWGKATVTRAAGVTSSPTFSVM